jgi:hypothetical protein
MTASLAFRWRHAELLVLSSLYGRQAADAVLSRPAARKPVASCSQKMLARGIPLPQRRVARAA